MARGSILDDPDRFRRAWNDLPFADRRRISRAVNRAEQLDDERDAQLAVMTARRQARFWSWAWLVGPLVSTLQFGGQDWTVAVTATGVSTVATGLLALWFLRRARAAEAVNLPLAQRAAGRGAPHPRSKEARAAERAGVSAGARPWQRRRRPRS